jgi:hypothetical protein
MSTEGKIPNGRIRKEMFRHTTIENLCVTEKEWMEGKAPRGTTKNKTDKPHIKIHQEEFWIICCSVKPDEARELIWLVPT